MKLVERIARKEKIQQNKDKLIEDVIEDLKSNIYENEDYIFILVREALRTRTQKELKQIIYGE